MSDPENNPKTKDDLGPPIDPELGQLFRDEPMPLPRAGVEERVAAKLATAGAFTAAVAAPTTALVATALPKLLFPIVTFVVGAGVGGGLLAALRPAPERVVYIDRPASVIPPIPPSVSVVAPRVPLMSSSSSSSAGPPAIIPRTSSSSAPLRDDLREERVLLDAGRSKLSAGDAVAAMKLLVDHEERFPRGRLTEEREALTVQALVNAGRYDDARKRAADLEKRYPKSVYLPAVKITLESIP